MMVAARFGGGESVSRIKNLQELLKRYRRPGDYVFSLVFLLFAVFLLVNLPYETRWVPRTKLYAQPAFWPAVSIFVMVAFSAIHLLGSLVSERIPGRWKEVAYWLRSLEYSVWFMAYVHLVPWFSYLPATVAFCLALSWRLGYRTWRWALINVAFAFAVVLLFKSFLQVKVPSGALYDLLPGTLRIFMITYF